MGPGQSLTNVDSWDHQDSQSKSSWGEQILQCLSDSYNTTELLCNAVKNDKIAIHNFTLASGHSCWTD
jgi:hypothetical protein